ncbi:dynein regulatory complex subunit 4 [Onthophagus taurus]|uniref:dynein regulatory complex subunit 4 n=1 Tax=Onthophagus taurus TaxID=166361 RepID=UPI0039BEB398
MPPKKDKKKPAIIIDGVDTTPMSREQLEVFAISIKEQNDREREERNFFQMERDKIRTFWEITRSELDEVKAKLRNKDRQIEEAAEANEEELRFFKQKVKHLQYEHQLDLTETKAEAMVSLKQALDDHTEQEKELLNDKRELKCNLREQEMNNLDQIKALKMQFSEDLHNAREDFLQQAKELEMKYEKRFQNLKEELAIKHRMEMSEVEERKNTQINDLTRNNESSFNDMKNYYNDITLNNLALISSLKDQMEVLRKQNERMSKQVTDLTHENKRLTEPLKQALLDVKEFKRQLVNYEKDKISLANTKIKLGQSQKELDDIRWHNEALELRFEKLQAEKDELHNRFVIGVLEVQQKTGLKNALLQKRIETLTNDAETKDAIIGELTTTKKLPSGLNAKFENILNKKNKTIADLQYELARVCKAHDDLVDTYEEKMVQYGIPKNELGFSPMRVLPEGQVATAKGPAGLVTKNP